MEWDLLVEGKELDVGSPGEQDEEQASRRQGQQDRQKASEPVENVPSHRLQQKHLTTLWNDTAGSRERSDSRVQIRRNRVSSRSRRSRISGFIFSLVFSTPSTPDCSQTKQAQICFVNAQRLIIKSRHSLVNKFKTKTKDFPDKVPFFLLISSKMPACLSVEFVNQEAFGRIPEI